MAAETCPRCGDLIRAEPCPSCAARERIAAPISRRRWLWMGLTFGLFFPATLAFALTVTRLTGRSNIDGPFTIFVGAYFVSLWIFGKRYLRCTACGAPGMTIAAVRSPVCPRCQARW